MNGGNQTNLRKASVNARVFELFVPGLFTLILLACLAHMAYCAFQAQCGLTGGFQYAISAFAL